MTTPAWPSGLPENFGGLESEYSALERARAVILPAPYDFSTSYQGGARLGPRAILACPPGEWHDLALMIFGVTLNRHGWRIDYLGVDTPVEEHRWSPQPAAALL